MNKHKYINRIAKKKLKYKSYFKIFLLVVEFVETNILISIVKKTKDFNEYIKNVNEINNAEGFLLMPQNIIEFDEEIFNIFDIYVINTLFIIENKYTKLEDVDHLDYYYKNLLFVKKNINNFIDIKIGSKIKMKNYPRCII